MNQHKDDGGDAAVTFMSVSPQLFLDTLDSRIRMATTSTPTNNQETDTDASGE